MQSEAFFDQLTTHFNAHLPFVAYRKPNQEGIKALLQQSDTLFTLKDYSESGFVMAPFDSSEVAVFFPIEHCDVFQTEFPTGGLSLVKQEDDNISSSVEKEFHINLVQKGIEAIGSGKLHKVVLSRQEKIPVTQSALSIFQTLLETYSQAFVYCWFHPEVGLWLGATPETLLKVENSRFTTMALAGTQVYKGTLGVSWGEKEIEEQRIVTDFIKNSLQASVENLQVSEVETAKAGNLLHLKTNIFGTINLGTGTDTLKQILEALHPTPAVCGFPKEEAKQFILENEGYYRGFYSGFLGELNLTESRSRNTNRRNVENNAYSAVKKVSNLFVNLRCMQLLEDEALVYIGGGITKDSIAEDEWQETQHKAKTMKRVLLG